MSLTSSYKLRGVAWEVTLRCNLKCLHCGSAAEPSHTRGQELSLDECQEVLQGLSHLGIEFITLSGGEPFLSPHWRNLATSICQSGIKLKFITNGSLLTSDTVDFLACLPTPPSLGFSLDGARPETHDSIRNTVGLYDQVFKAAERLNQRDIAWSVVTCVNRMNLPELYDLYEILKDKGLYAWQLQPAMPMGRMRKNLDLVLDEEGFRSLARIIVELRLKDDLQVYCGDALGYYCSLEPELRDFFWSGCKAGINYIGLRSNGDVTGCLSLQDANPEGNVRQRSIEEIWNDGELFSYNRHFDPALLEGHCRDCSLDAICKGGCRLLSMSFTGSFFNNPICLRQMEDQSNSNVICIG